MECTSPPTLSGDNYDEDSKVDNENDMTNITEAEGGAKKKRKRNRKKKKGIAKVYSYRLEIIAFIGGGGN